jgi:hypothetical protein
MYSKVKNFISFAFVFSYHSKPMHGFTTSAGSATGHKKALLTGEGLGGAKNGGSAEPPNKKLKTIKIPNNYKS